jgi:hypothetical protein
LPYQLEGTFADDGYVESTAVALSKQDFLSWKQKYSFLVFIPMNSKGRCSLPICCSIWAKTIFCTETEFMNVQYCGGFWA